MAKKIQQTKKASDKVSLDDLPIESFAGFGKDKSLIDAAFNKEEKTESNETVLPAKEKVINEKKSTEIQKKADSKTEKGKEKPEKNVKSASDSNTRSASLKEEKVEFSLNFKGRIIDENKRKNVALWPQNYNRLIKFKEDLKNKKGTDASYVTIANQVLEKVFEFYGY